MELLSISDAYARKILQRLKSRAKERGIEFDLDIGDILNLTVPLTCPILNIPLKENTGKQQDNSVSVDRINNNQGYISDNIMVMSWRANKLKGDASLEELKSLCQFINSDAITMTSNRE